MCAQLLTLAFPTIGRVSMVTRHACLALGTGGEVTALLTNAAVHTCAVAITLTSCRKTKEVMDCQMQIISKQVNENFPI